MSEYSHPVPGRRGRPPGPPEATTALYVRLPTELADRLARASLELRRPKRELVAELLTRHLLVADPEALGPLRTPAERRRVIVEPSPPELTVGHHSFRPTAELEVLTARQLAELLQLDEAAVIDLAERGDLPGRRLGLAWRFSRAAVLRHLGGAAVPEP